VHHHTVHFGLRDTVDPSIQMYLSSEVSVGKESILKYMIKKNTPWAVVDNFTKSNRMQEQLRMD
jgi:hypothetical protein